MMIKCPLCSEIMEYVGITGKLLHFVCPNKECLCDLDVYEKEKSNNPKIINKKIIKGEHPDFKQRLD